MEKISFNDFKEYLRHNDTSDVICDGEKVSLLVYCYEGEYALLTIPVEEAYNDFYEFVVNEPEEVIFRGQKMIQMRELTIDWVVAQGYESSISYNL